MYTREQIKTAVESKEYKWFNDNANKGYDVNIIGVRNTSPSVYRKVTNVFDDFLTISFKDEKGVEQFYCWAATTDPGKKGVQQFHNKKGVARLVPGQYRTTWAVDLHQGKYSALCQRLGEVTVWRDGNRDMVFDEVVKDTGVFGINIHKAGQDSTWVENWSEGCQVFKRVKDFDAFMSICRKAAKIHGNKFSYTLLESTDIK
jgi:hypothetical protein